MILDTLTNAHRYAGLSERFQQAFDYLTKTDLSKLEPGKYELDGDNLKIAVQEYLSRDEADCKIEAHKRYAEIQYIVSGEEKMGIDNLTDQKPITEYNDVKDVWFFGEYDYLIKIKAGMFAVFFPNDIHMPCLKVSDKSEVKKVVVKVLL